MKDNVLFVCLDSLRYDTFMAASTPNMDALGQVKRVHSFSCWTLPSIVGYLMNYPPIGLGGPEHMYPFKYCGRGKWAPLTHREEGFETAWISGNAMINNFDHYTNGGFQRGFDHFVWKRLKPVSNSVQTAQEEILEIVKSGSPPFFITTLLMETHEPYFWGGKAFYGSKENPEKNFEYQVKAAEYVDGWFPRVLEPLRALENRTHVIVTSDHGELFGPEYFGHDPSYRLQFDEKLFEIPFLEGVI